MRLTRAQLRAQEDATPNIYEDAETIAQATFKEPDQDNDAARPVLKDITAINTLQLAVEEIIEDMPAKKAKGRKAGKKNAKKNNKEMPPVAQELNLDEVFEDDNQSDSSQTAEIAAAELRDDNSIPETSQVPLDMDNPQTPTSAAVSEATRTLSLSPTKNTTYLPKTPKFDPAEHRNLSSNRDSEQDSFVGSMRKASPFKLPMSQEHQDTSSDSFVEQIIVRTPYKPMCRIEDSVDAIDALEDAIEQVATELPLLSGNALQSSTKKIYLNTSPQKDSPKRKIESSSKSPSSRSLMKGRTPQSSSSISLPNKLAQSGKSPARQPFKATTTHSIIAKPQPALAATSSTRQISFSQSPAKPQANMTHKRAPGTLLSTSKAPFMPAKSTKPPTKSTFTLPGDAIAAKLKAEREERQKREGSAKKTKPVKPAGPSIQQKRATSVTTKSPRKPSFQLPGDAVAAKLKAQREARAQREASAQAEKAKAPKPTLSVPSFKARPAPSRPRPSVVPRDNKASQARMSLMQSNSPNKENVAPKPKAGARIEVAKNRRQTTVTVAAPTTAPGQLSGAARTAANIASRRSVSGQKIAAGTPVDNKLIMTMTKAEKEEAAKKARAEAAERGRQASREWAERQKMKMAKVKVRTGEGEKLEIVAAV